MSDVKSTAPPDVDTIRRTLAMLVEPGQVIELRGLDASTPRRRYPHTISGYFRDPEKCADAAAKADPYVKGVYVTLNVLKPALLARAANRVRAVAKNDPLTADHDVERRRWFPIDCDPVRPAGISATDDEHESALQRARTIRDALRKEGWPNPVMADAGNSGHLLYPIDLPNDDTSRTWLQACLEALAARFNDAVVHIDTSVYNAARIWRLYGTWNRKGDDTDERPHRQATLLDVPEARVCVTHEQLEALARMAPRREQAHHGPRANGRFFDIEAWIAGRQVEIDGPEPWKDGRKWVLPVCPWNASHTNSSAYILQFADGGLDAGCHHNGCQGRGWPALRDVLEPGWRNGGPASDQEPHSSHSHDTHPPSDDGVPHNSSNSFNSSSLPWPTLDPLTFYGLAGEVVKTIAPHTEADEAGLLLQTLIAFGNVIGRQPHCMAEADYHGLNEFAVLVGATSKGRKGSSAGHIRRLLARVDPEWVGGRMQAGLSSGEGLIWAVRDPIVKREAVREKGRPTGEYEDVMVDHGVDDKRLLVFEAELSSTLRVLGRDGNILSAVIRQAWDDGTLRVLTKNSPAMATAAHISIVGHITRDELLRYLDSTEAGNGFGNRFLWCCVRRSRALPEGGNLRDGELTTLVMRIKHAVDAARKVGLIVRDEDARAIWREIYPELSEGASGLLGAMTSRAEAHVMRLSAIYALMDTSAVVKPDHLLAALALWKYCEDSAKFIFGESLGDPLADEMLRLLRASAIGMTKTDISNHFGRNKSSAQLSRALNMLEQQGLARCEAQETGGRMAEVWRATGSTN